MIGPHGIRAARVDLGRKLSAFREAARLTQEQLATKINYGRSTVASAETGYSECSRDFWARCDHALATDGVLVTAYDHVKELKAIHARSVAVGLDRRADGSSGDAVRRRDFLPLAATALVATTLASPLAELVAAIVGDHSRPYTAEPPSHEFLHRQVNQAKSLYQACEYERLTAGLPALLDQLKAAQLAADGAQLAWTHELTAITYHVTASVLLKTGDVPLALIAAERSSHLAGSSQNPVTIAASARIIAHALASSGYGDHAIDTAQRAAQRLEANQSLASNEAASVYGALVLRAATAAARCNDRDRTTVLLDEGERAAAFLGHDGNHYWTGFGPTNVLLHRVNAALSLGDAGTAIDLARKVDLQRVALTERKACLYVDVAQAYTQWGRRRQALSALRMAYSIAPQEVRTRRAVRGIVNELVAVASGPERSDALEFAAAAGLPL